MSKIYVKNTKGDESLQISFEFCYNGKGREFNAVRPKTESIEDTFKRISQNIAKFFNKKSKRKRKQGEEDPDALNISMKVFGPDGNSSIALESTSEEALKHGNVVTISSEKYTVDVNPPYCHSILLPQIVMVGFPIYPKLDTEFCSLDDSVYVWEKVKYTEVAANNDNKSNQQELERTEVCRCLSYSAVNDDIGYKLALTVTPKCGDRLGKSVSSESKFEVTAGPGLCPFEERQKWTEKLTDYDE
ncbi:hypothetical protein DPMN_188231 [Dreissena polymorpha]|nr:hypothetical protein DPMN_188231 [Dreissena polymorpha]